MIINLLLGLCLRKIGEFWEISVLLAIAFQYLNSKCEEIESIEYNINTVIIKEIISKNDAWRKSLDDAELGQVFNLKPLLDVCYYIYKYVKQIVLYIKKNTIYILGERSDEFTRG